MNCFRKIKKGELIYFKSDNILAAHGFSTRYGGVSKTDYLKTMNFGFSRGDSVDNIRENYRRFRLELGLEKHILLTAEQIHSNYVYYCDGKRLYGDHLSSAFIPSDYKLPTSDMPAGVEPEATNTSVLCGDAFVTDKDNVALCIKIADCVPVLFCDNVNHVIGAAHAGWRGTVTGIARKTVKIMQEHGADAEFIQVAIGPSIHYDCYEVGFDMYDYCVQEAGADFVNKYIHSAGDSAMHCDLQGMNREILMEAGIPEENISISESCTCCQPDMFFSHRASKGKRGTMAAIIGF